MGERESQLDRNVDLDFESGIGGPVEETAPGERDDDRSRRSQLRSRAGSVVSSRGLLVSVVLVVAGVVVLGTIPLLGFLGELLGIFAGAFLYGLAVESRRYVELALAGALVGGGSALLSNVVLTLLGAGIPLVLIGLLGGVIAGVLGHYFGRDLRDGLTREI